MFPKKLRGPPITCECSIKDDMSKWEIYKYIKLMWSYFYISEPKKLWISDFIVERTEV